MDYGAGSELDSIQKRGIERVPNVAKVSKVVDLTACSRLLLTYKRTSSKNEVIDIAGITEASRLRVANPHRVVKYRSESPHPLTARRGFSCI